MSAPPAPEKRKSLSSGSSGFRNLYQLNVMGKKINRWIKAIRGIFLTNGQKNASMSIFQPEKYSREGIVGAYWRMSLERLWRSRSARAPISDFITLPLNSPPLISVRCLLTSQKNFFRTRLNNVQFIESDAEKIDFPKDTFDSIVSTLSLCSYRDHIRMLNNFNKWCKPDGGIYLLEHGLSSNKIFGVNNRNNLPSAALIAVFAGCWQGI